MTRRPSSDSHPPSQPAKPTLLELAAGLVDPAQPMLRAQPGATSLQPAPLPPLRPVMPSLSSRPVQTLAAVTSPRLAKPAPPASAPASAAASAPAPAPSGDELIKAKFRVRFHRQLGLIAIMVPGIWAAKLDSPHIDSPGQIAGLAAIFIGFALTLVNWRCPQCNRYLYRRLYPRRCPRCDVIFHD